LDSLERARLEKGETRRVGARKAVSPVLATVILVAVSITIAVAVAYWMGGIAGQYTKFEQVEIQSVISNLESDGNWSIQMILKNSGTATATLVSATVNHLEVNEYNATYGVAQWNTNMSTSESITSGASRTIVLYIDADRTGTSLSSGTSINVNFHSASGMDYIKLVSLP
jgi:flagellin-like protein